MIEEILAKFLDENWRRKKNFIIFEGVLQPKWIFFVYKLTEERRFSDFCYLITSLLLKILQKIVYKCIGSNTERLRSEQIETKKLRIISPLSEIRTHNAWEEKTAFWAFKMWKKRIHVTGSNMTPWSGVREFRLTHVKVCSIYLPKWFFFVRTPFEVIFIALGL